MVIFTRATLFDNLISGVTNRAYGDQGVVFGFNNRSWDVNTTVLGGGNNGAYGNGDHDIGDQGLGSNGNNIGSSHLEHVVARRWRQRDNRVFAVFDLMRQLVLQSIVGGST